MSDKVLVKFEGNWADEIDFNGHCVMTREQWDQLMQKAAAWFMNNAGDEYTYCIGTNEDFEWSDYREWRDCYKVVEITEDEAVVLMKYSNRQNIVGMFAWPVFDLEDDGDEE